MELVQLRQRMLRYLVCVVPAAMLLAAIEVTGALLASPALLGQVPLLFVASSATFAAFALPFALLLAVVEPLLVKAPRPAPELALAGGLGVVLAAGATRGLHGYFERVTTEFPVVVDRVKDAGALVLVTGAFLLAWLSLPMWRQLLARAPRLREGHAVLVVTGALAAALFGAYIPATLGAIHGHPWSQVSVLVGLPLWLLVVRARVAGVTGRAALASAAVAALLVVAGLASLQHPATAFHFRSSLPSTLELHRLLRPVADSDGDGALAALFGGDDCAPFDAAIGPQAREVLGDGVDQDCRGGDASAAAATPARLPSPLWPGCAEPPPGGWSVLLVTIDSLRASVLEPRVTPALATLAPRSAWFTRAYSPATNTNPSFCSLFSGLPASEVVLRNTAEQVLLKPVADTLPVVFQRAGYRTGMAFTFGAPEIVTAGFDVKGPAHVDPSPREKFDFASADITRAAVDFLEDTPTDRPFFFWAHYPDAHAPYLDPFKSGAALSEEQRYLAEVRYVDHHVGRLLHALENSPRRDSTLVVLTSDHGEDLRERGKEGHGPDVYERSVHVPLALYVPGCPSALVEQPVSGRDIYATLATLAGHDAAAPTLFDAVSGAAREQPVVTEARFQDQLRRAVVTARYKLIVDVHGGGRLLFDLEEDPAERTSIYGEQPVTDELEALYQRWLDRP